MRRERRRPDLGVFLCVLCFIATIAEGANPVWSTTVQGESEIELKGSAPAQDGGLWLLVGLRERGRLAGLGQAFELRRVDSLGNENLREPLRLPSQARAIEPVIGVGATGPVVAWPAGDGIVNVQRLDAKTGKVLGTASITTPDADVFITGVAKVGGDLVVLGRTGVSGFMLRTDGSNAGPVSVISEGDTTVLVSGTGRRSEEVSVLGKTLHEDGVVETWIGTFSASGRRIVEGDFGEEARVVSRGNGGVVVAHDAKRDGGWDVWVKGFSANLEEQWRIQVVAGARRQPRFNLGSGSSGWILAVERDRRLAVTLGTDSGTHDAWRVVQPLNEKWERLWNVGIPEISGDRLIVPFTVVTLDDAGAQHQVVRVTAWRLGR